MFVAYSKKLQDIVHINDVKDLKDEFSCLNPYCTAKFYVRAVNSDGKSAHFAKWPKQHHIPGCPYAMEDGKYIDTGQIIKTPVEDIYNQISALKTETSPQTPPKHKTTNDIIVSKTYIRNVRQLLQYCISNDLNTYYLDDVKVKDIILDARNLELTYNFMGITGLRLLLGTTYKYEAISNGYNIFFNVKSVSKKTGSNLALHACVTVSEKQGNDIISYILNTFEKIFKGHSIAVLGDWTTTSTFFVSCTALTPSHVVYRFAHEKN